MGKVRVLLVGAGAGFSTKDVEMGYYEAFEDLGVDLSYYCLDQRIYSAVKWLRFQWKYQFKYDPTRAPTWADAVYRGGIEALEMGLRYEVDFVFVISAMYLHPDALIMMKRAGLHVGILLTESPYEDEKQAKVASLADVVFTNERTSVAYLREFNPNTYYMRHAYSPVRHKPPATNGTAVTRGAVQALVPEVVNGAAGPVGAGHDVVFVGTGFQERIDLLKEVDWSGSGIDLGLYGHWELLAEDHPLRQYVKGGFMSNMEAHDLYQASKIGLNLYRTSQEYVADVARNQVTTAESMNPRAYELAAAGIFSLTQLRREGVETLKGSQPTFLTPGHLEHQIKYYLGRADLKGDLVSQAESLIQGHTFLERAKEVLNYA